MKLIRASVLMCAGIMATPLIWAESTPTWTLRASMQRALELAPEMTTAEADIARQQGKLEQAGAWPNPNISLQMNNVLGIEDSSGGYDLTELAITQPLPLGRLKRQQEQANSGYASAIALRQYQQLLLEYKVAQRFHVLQLAAAKLELAQQRLAQASRYQNTGNDPLIRYLTPLEVMRLDIVLQAAKQTAEVAEGKYNEAAASLKALLVIPVNTELQLTPLTPVAIPAAFTAMLESLKNHPALVADQQTLASAQAGIEVAKAQRFSDPTLTLSRGKNFLANRREDTTALMLNVQIPLWNQNNGPVTQARASMQQAQAELAIKQRDLQSSLHKNYIHLGHLIAQAQHYRDKLLKPAEKVFSLTRKGFAAGELNILTLIDANNTYFAAQERYFELLQESWQELAEVRRSAGLSLLSHQSASPATPDLNGVN